MASSNPEVTALYLLFFWGAPCFFGNPLYFPDPAILAVGLGKVGGVASSIVRAATPGNRLFKYNVEENTNVSNLKDISHLMQKIKLVYDSYIKDYVHHRW